MAQPGKETLSSESALSNLAQHPGVSYCCIWLSPLTVCPNSSRYRYAARQARLRQMNFSLISGGDCLGDLSSTGISADVLWSTDRALGWHCSSCCSSAELEAPRLWLAPGTDLALGHCTHRFPGLHSLKRFYQAQSVLLLSWYKTGRYINS